MLANIDHFVVLMLENRSFDSMLGKLYTKSDKFEGLTGNESNLDTIGTLFQVWSNSQIDQQTMSIPNPDPGEL